MRLGVARAGRYVAHSRVADIWQTLRAIYEILAGRLKSHWGFEQVHVAVMIVVQGARV